MKKLVLVFTVMMLIAVVVMDAIQIRKEIRMQKQDELLLQQTTECSLYLQNNPDGICD